MERYHLLNGIFWQHFPAQPCCDKRPDFRRQQHRRRRDARRHASVGHSARERPGPPRAFPAAPFLCQHGWKAAGAISSRQGGPPRASLRAG